VRSQTTPRFRALLTALPEQARRQAREAYRHFSADPHHPSLHFKRVRDQRPTHSVRIGVHYRALGYFESDTIVWVWIGSHAEYDRLLGSR
jgi:hypothetical protein